MSKDGKKIWLSPTGLGVLDRCPRCFWLQYKKGIRQPEGIVSRLANRFDSVIKKYFDLYRAPGELPPMVDGKVEGKLQYPFIETYFYHHDDNFGFYGKLDECLVTSQRMFTPVDHKTSSSDPREKETLPAYQQQLDAYAWLLEENGKKTTGIGHLIYFYPDHSQKLHEGFKMVIHIQTLKTNPKNTQKRFIKAVEVLKFGMPDPSADCPFCNWYNKINEELSF